MIPKIGKITRVALFAALVFIFSYAGAFLYNVNFSFFIVFSAGLLWGFSAGAGVGIIGFFLWSNFNPMGPAPLPLLLSQMAGITFSALIGSASNKIITPKQGPLMLILYLSLAGLLSGLLYHMVVDVVDAWLYQPFWPRLIGGLLFSLITIISNAILFPLLWPVIKFIYPAEKEKQMEMN